MELECYGGIKEVCCRGWKGVRKETGQNRPETLETHSHLSQPHSFLSLLQSLPSCLTDKLT